MPVDEEKKVSGCVRGGSRKERETIMIMLMLLVCLRSLEMRTDLPVALKCRATVEMLVGVKRQ